MNIFVLSEDPVQAAQWQCDKHVVKMIIESAQMLSSAVVRHGGECIYKPTHKHHPCTIWAGDSHENWSWLYRHFVALSLEYEARYKKQHLSYKKMTEWLIMDGANEAKDIFPSGSLHLSHRPCQININKKTL